MADDGISNRRGGYAAAFRQLEAIAEAGVYNNNNNINPLLQPHSSGMTLQQQLMQQQQQQQQRQNNPCQPQYNPAVYSPGSGSSSTGGMMASSGRDPHHHQHHSLLVSVQVNGPGFPTATFNVQQPTYGGGSSGGAQQQFGQYQQQQQQQQQPQYTTTTSTFPPLPGPFDPIALAAASSRSNNNNNNSGNGNSGGGRGHNRISSFDQFLINNAGLLTGTGLGCGPAPPGPVVSSPAAAAAEMPDHAFSMSNLFMNGNLLGEGMYQQQPTPPPQQEPWLEDMSLKVSGLSLEPMSGTEVLSRLRGKMDDVLTRYLPCVEFLVSCQQDLRRGLSHAQRHRRHFPPRQFYLTYVQPLPQKFQIKNQFVMEGDALSEAMQGLLKLSMEAKKAERHGLEAIKNQFLGGMKDGESWGLRKWLSRNGNALRICTDLECIAQACRALDQKAETTRKFAELLRPLAQQALDRLKADIPQSYQEHSSAHPYLPFFHRLESALRTMSSYDPEDEGIVVIDDSDDDDDGAPAPAPPPRRQRPAVAKPNPVCRKRSRGSNDTNTVDIDDSPTPPTERKRPSAVAPVAVVAAAFAAPGDAEARTINKEPFSAPGAPSVDKAPDLKRPPRSEQKQEQRNEDRKPSPTETNAARAKQEPKKQATSRPRIQITAAKRKESLAAQVDRLPGIAAADSTEFPVLHGDDSSSGESDDSIIEVVAIKPPGVVEAATNTTEEWRCPTCSHDNTSSGDVCLNCGETNFMKDLHGQFDTWLEDLVGGSSGIGSDSLSLTPQWPLPLTDEANVSRAAAKLSDSLDRLAAFFDEGRQGSVRPASAPFGSFWDGSRYADALRLFGKLLRDPVAIHFVFPVDNNQVAIIGQLPYTDVIKHPVCFREIVTALIVDAEGGHSSSLHGGNGRIPGLRMNSWNMWKGDDLLQTIDLVFLNSLAYGKALDCGKSKFRSDTNRLRKRFWNGISDILLRNGIGSDDEEQRRFCMPCRRSESSGFVVHRQR